MSASELSTRARECASRNDHSAAFEFYMKAAELGNSGAQHDVGLAYKDGRGVKQDHEKALEWFQKSANQGSSYAQCAVGAAYKDGRGVKQDYGKAMEWLQKSADQGWGNAHYFVAGLYENGLGVTKDLTKTFEHLSKAAQCGFGVAYGRLGSMYNKGEGVQQDYQKAMECFLKAEKTGLTSASHSIGVLYREGHGVPKDATKALEWFLKAKDTSYVQLDLGNLYFRGDLPKDLNKAAEWYELAAKSGFSLAAARLAEVKAEMNKAGTQKSEPKKPETENDPWRCKWHRSQDHDFFISYRVNPDKALAYALAMELSTQKTSGGEAAKVFLDVKCLPDGEDWESNFLRGINSSKVIVLLMSSEGLARTISAAHEQQDNVLLEVEHALHRAATVKGVRVVPVFVKTKEVLQSKSGPVDFYHLFFPRPEDFQDLAHSRKSDASFPGVPTTIKGVIERVLKLNGIAYDPSRHPIDSEVVHRLMAMLNSVNF